MTYKVVVDGGTGEFVVYHGHSPKLALDMHGRLVERFVEFRETVLGVFQTGLKAKVVSRDDEGHETVMVGFEQGGTA